MELTTILNRMDIISGLAESLISMADATRIYYAPKELGKMDEINAKIRELSDIVDDERRRIAAILRSELREEQRQIRRR